MPRRTVEYFQGAYLPYTLVAMFGALLILGALGSIALQLLLSTLQRHENMVSAGDPWNGRNLEWLTPSPPPAYNFAVVPRVRGREEFMAKKLDGTTYRAPLDYEDIEMPCNSAVGPLIAASAAACGFALVWHIWWLAAVGLLAVIATVIARSFVRETSYVIPAHQVRFEHERWLLQVAAGIPVGRDQETASANRGLAEATAA
jgi:cytochrome o ubiquinol oxidase subunit 1